MKHTALKPAFSRFKGAPWFNGVSSSRIFIGGAGGIGSHLCFQLARTGAHIVIADYDNVEAENLAGQLYGPSDIGKSKVTAIKHVCGRLCDDPSVNTMEMKLTKDTISYVPISRSDVVCVGFDNLETRRLVYDFWREHGRLASLFIDGRLGFEGGQVFVLEHSAQEAEHIAYQETYFGPEESVPLPCSTKATTHCGSLIASMMMVNITNWFSNRIDSKRAAPVFRREVRNLEFHLPIMLFDAIEAPLIEQQVTTEEHESH